MTEDTFDVTAICKLKHADLWAAAKKLGGQGALAKHIGVHRREVDNWINLRSVPPADPLDGTRWTEDLLRDVEAKLAVLTGKSWDELFPPALRENVEFLACEKTVERTASLECGALLAYAKTTTERLSLGYRDSTNHEEVIDAINLVFRTLSFREREIVKLRYGLDGKDQHTLMEVAGIFQVGKERIRQIEANALRKLQQPTIRRVLEEADQAMREEP